MKRLKTLRDNLVFRLAGNGRQSQKIEIPEIPTTWQKFEDSNDEWIKVEFPESEDATACIYKAKAGSVFNAHSHESTERLFILNKEGKLKSYTETSRQTITFPNGVFFKENEKHLIKFITDTEIMVIWSPRFKRGWQATVSK